jgi:hypothetical protein
MKHVYAYAEARHPCPAGRLECKHARRHLFPTRSLPAGASADGNVPHGGNVQPGLKVAALDFHCAAKPKHLNVESGRPDMSAELALFVATPARRYRVVACGSKSFTRAVHKAAAAVGARMHDITWQL